MVVRIPASSEFFFRESRTFWYLNIECTKFLPSGVVRKLERVGGMEMMSKKAEGEEVDRRDHDNEG